MPVAFSVFLKYSIGRFSARQQTIVYYIRIFRSGRYENEYTYIDKILEYDHCGAGTVFGGGSLANRANWAAGA
jgi:hypothetical protein